MAIKGKGKTKPKQAARAPRRAPVPVKPPFAKRTWVKVTAAFIAGVFALSMFWWVYENLDQDRNAQAAANRRTQQQQAVSAWKQGLDTGIADIAQLQGAATPQIATTLAPAIEALRKGTDPQVTPADMQTLAKQLDTAADALEGFALSDAIADRGFDRNQTDVIVGAQAELVAGLRSLSVAARLTALAIVSSEHRDELLAAANDATQAGQDLIARGWTKYANISTEVGAPLGPPQGLAPASGS